MTDEDDTDFGNAAAAAMLGRWEGDTFTYDIPVELPDGKIIKEITIAEDADIHPDITRDAMIVALANAISVEPADDGPDPRLN